MNENVEHYAGIASELATARGPKVIGAILTLIVGLRIIKWISKIANKGFEASKLDITVSKFLSSLIGTGLKLLLLISVAGMFGIQTTSFIAILGAAGLAVGMALQGSLSNFAGGVLLLVFKPYQVGDLVEAQGTFGRVSEISVFTTKLTTPDNKIAIIPNGPMANGNIINFTQQGEIRVDVNVGIAYDEDIDNARKVLTEAIAKVPSINQQHGGNGVFVSELADSSVNLIVRGFTNPDTYRDAFFGITEESKKALDSSGIDIPFPHRVIHTVKE